VGDRQAGQVLQLRGAAVQRLQQQEAGDAVDPALGRLHRPQRQLLDPLVGAADDVGEEAVQSHRGADIERRRDVALVEHQLAVLHLADAGQAQADAAIGLVAGDAEAQVRPRRLDRLAGPLVGEGVVDLLLVHQEARRITALVAGLELDRPRLPRRQGQVDDGVAGVRRHVERRRRRIVVRS
jgi:hypothetical protein